MPSRLSLLDWRAVSKNTLRGFAKIKLPNGLIISDIAVHTINDQWWAALPATPQIENGQHREVDGKKQYKKILEWGDRSTGDQFSAAVIELLKEQRKVAE